MQSPACRSVTPASASVFTRPSCLCVCVSNFPLPSFMGTPVIGLRAHPKSRMFSPRGPYLHYIRKTPFPNEVTFAGTGVTTWIYHFGKQHPTQDHSQRDMLAPTPVHKLTFCPQKRDSEQDRKAKNWARTGVLLSPPSSTAFSLCDLWLTTSGLVCMVHVRTDTSQLVCQEIGESREASGSSRVQ